MTCETAAQGSFTFEERVEAQAAVENFYHGLRADWAASRGLGTYPSFEERVPRALLERRAEDAVRMSEALEELFGENLGGAEIQAEINRMAGESNDPEKLFDGLFAALGNDALLIGDTLARGLLAERRLRERFAASEDIHAGERARAEELAVLVQAALDADEEDAMRRHGGADYSCFIFTRVSREQAERLGTGDQFASFDGPCLAFNYEEEEYANVLSELPAKGAPLAVEETRESFVIRRSAQQNPHRAKLEQIIISKIRFEDWWAGVRGDFPCCSPPPPAVHLPLPPGPPWDRCLQPSPWSPLATKGGTPPSARAFHTAVWTGAEMIVWGGCCNLGCGGEPVNYYNTGGEYRPVDGSWKATLPLDPEETQYGADVLGLVESGQTGESAFPAPFTLLPSGTDRAFVNYSVNGEQNQEGVPFCFDDVKLVFTDSDPDAEISMAGVEHNDVTQFYQGNGLGNYKMVFTRGSGPCGVTGIANITDVTMKVESLGSRYGHSALWSGTEMLIWGGSPHAYRSGWRYDNVAGTWTAMPLPTLIPLDFPGRAYHSYVWVPAADAGEGRMLIWGGQLHHNQPTYDDGMIYTLPDNTWTMMNQADSPTDRAMAATCYAPEINSMLVWGGVSNTSGVLGNGKRYSVAVDQWNSQNLGASDLDGKGEPSPRVHHGFIQTPWTGSEMLIWGGNASLAGNVPGFSDGGAYDPLTDQWRALNQTGAPSGRWNHQILWAQEYGEMLVWGGQECPDPPDCGSAGYLGNGGRYDPALDSWRPIGHDSAVIAPRAWQGMVWTGNKLLVWGGLDEATHYGDGAAWTPLCEP